MSSKRKPPHRSIKLLKGNNNGHNPHPSNSCFGIIGGVISNLNSTPCVSRPSTLTPSFGWQGQGPNAKVQRPQVVNNLAMSVEDGVFLCNEIHHAFGGRGFRWVADDDVLDQPHCASAQKLADMANQTYFEVGRIEVTSFGEGGTRITV
ncbi:hypothetical protein VNO78_19677 [Psophocarpus tetragonolobus]|uniref:Uncharacterized protein n=1 Tax=Psophocarpus tetragonolobus TaxID=3891 RepID=A0AAN9S7Y5_PSOTE